MQIDFRRKVGTLILALLFVFSATLAFGQIVTGSISGVVEDQQHAMVSGAKVTAHQDGTSYERTTTTTDAGLFALTGLPVGTYTVTVEAAKFSKLKINNVGVTVAKDSSLGVRTLTIGTTEVVNVEGTAPLVESNTTQIATSFTNKKVADLPVGSGYDFLALLVPGVAPAGDAGFSNSNGAQFSTNGQRGRSNNFQIDGQANNDNSVAGPSIFLGNQDLIGEFQVITNYSAEFGRNMGSVVNYITKGGTNSFHGTAFEYYSSNWASSFANEEKSGVFGFCQPGQTPAADGCDNPENPKFIDNRWGLTFGGPIIKDKAWFFFSYLGEHVRTAGFPFFSGSALTPSPAGLATLTAAYPGNNFVNALNTIGPFRTGVNPGDPQCVGTPSLRTVSDGVTTTVGVPFCQVKRTLGFPSNDRELTGRVDIQLSSKDRLTARYILQDQIFINGTGRAAAGAVVDIPARGQQIALDWTRSFSSRFVNSFRFNYARLSVGFEGGNFPDCTQANFDSCPTGITLSGGNNLSFGMQSNLPQGRLVNNSQWQDNASWVHGRHTLKFGGEYTRQRSPNGFLPNILGTFTFTNGCLAPLASTTFNCALRNRPAQLNLTDGSMFFEFKEQDAAFYGQDEWRVKDNLTLIFGVRYEYFQQAVNQLHNLDVARESDPATAIWNSTLSQDVTTVHAIKKDMNNWGPNVGFAWTPKIWTRLFGENKTVIRGGFRVTYDPSFYNMFLNVRTASPNVNAGFFLGTACTAPCLPADPTAGGVRTAHLPDIPTGTIAPGTDPSCFGVAVAVNPGCRNNTLVTDDFHNPYSEQWNIGMQRQITSKMAFEVRYVGNHTIGNFQTTNHNPALQGLIAFGFNGTGVCGGGPVATFTCPNLIPPGVTPCLDATQPGFSGRRADCAHRNVNVRANSAWSGYNSMQTRFDINNWHGVTANLGYTWAHSMSNADEVFSTLGGGGTIAAAQNPFDINRAERGNSGLDYRHVATVALIYETPWYKNQQGFMGHLLGGWQFNIVHRYTSGQPWTPGQLAGENSICQNAFNGTFDSCRPFTNNTSAPLDTVGYFCNGTAGDCRNAANAAQPFGTFISFYDPCLGAPAVPACGGVTPIPADSTHYILDNNAAALIFGTPYSNTARNSQRGETINNTNFSVFKSTRISERFKLRFEAHAWNVLNRQWRGVPDPFVEDFPANLGGSFANTNFNPSGGFSANVVQSGIGRRRLNFGIKLIF